MKKSLGAKCLIYPAPVLVVGTYDKAGKPNVMTAAWGGICSAQPPCITVSLRTATLSHESILARKAFTISIPSEPHVKAVDFFGLVSGRTTDKLAAAKLTAVRSKVVDAPYIREFPLVLECKLVDVAEIGLHVQFIGEVVDAKADESIIGSGGAVDITRLRPLVYAVDSQDYHAVGAAVGKVFSAGQAL